MNTSPPPESSSRSAAAPTRTTPGTIVIGSTCWAVMTPMIADPQTPRSSCVYYCTLRTLAPAIHHTKVHVKALDARLGALPCQESWVRTRRTPHRPRRAGPTRDARPGGQTREHVDVAADRAAQPQRAPDTDPDQPHRPVRTAGRLPDGHPVAPGELLQVRP